MDVEQIKEELLKRRRLQRLRQKRKRRREKKEKLMQEQKERKGKLLKKAKLGTNKDGPADIDTDPSQLTSLFQDNLGAKEGVFSWYERVC